MRLNSASSSAPRRRGALPSVGAVVVVAAVLGANSWWLLRDQPAPSGMSEAQRLQVAHQDQERVKQVAAAAEAARAEADRPDEGVVATEPKVDKLELSAAQVQKKPAVPVPMPIERLATVQPGDSLLGAMERLFIHGPTANALVKAYSKIRSPRRLRVGHLLYARFNSPSPMDAESLVSLVVAPRSGSGGITIEREENKQGWQWRARKGGQPGVVERRALRCGVTASLSRSLQRCGHSEQLASLVGDGLAARLSLRSDVRRGDEVRVVYDELVAAGQHVRYERVLAIRYTGRRHKLTGIFFDNGRGQADWYKPDGSALEPMFTTHLVNGARLTSGFGMRLHPILKVNKMHNGLDYAAGSGTPIRAAADGAVIKVGRGGAAGNFVRVKHEQGYVTEYMHMLRFARRSKLGQRVQRGQVIGYVGSTGRSTAPHLHFGVIRHGKYIDPLLIRDVPGIGVGAKDRDAFAEYAAKLALLLDALDKSGTGAS